MEHYPVMLSEALEYLAIRPDGRYVDATAGLGGHSRAIAERLQAGRLITLDRDEESLELARQRCAEYAPRITFARSAFSELAATLTALGAGRVDGILADLGVSRMQLTTPERGFSLMHPGPLDMRMDRRQELTAAELVNRLPERELEKLFIEYGEERRHAARKIARALVEARPVTTMEAFAQTVARVVPRTGKLHPATRCAQALRMVVNSESEELDALLEQAPRHLAPGGRFVVIAFQSIDDRRVKLAFRELGKQGRARLLTKHVVKPGAEETRRNPASRSAVLRALEWIGSPSSRLEEASEGGERKS
jgi:16S rRNA (cytosine1402-N4)-methyltransferase